MVMSLSMILLDLWLIYSLGRIYSIAPMRPYMAYMGHRRNNIDIPPH